MVLARLRPDLADPIATIRAGHVWVDGWQVKNPDSLVSPEASVVVKLPQPLRGEAKLRAALARFAPAVAGRVALDLGASAGGFTRVLLEAGARRVYAVDAGVGQLLGSLRQDPRVVNLERTNLAELDRARVPDPIEVVTIDLSYLALAAAVPQLTGVTFTEAAEMIALVKPMFELGLDAPPVDEATLAKAVRRAEEGLTAAGWPVVDRVRSPVPGQRGAIELLLHARRA